MNNPVLAALQELSTDHLSTLAWLGTAFQDVDGGLFAWMTELERLCRAERFGRRFGDVPLDTNTLVTITGRLSEHERGALILALGNAKRAALSDAPLTRLLNALGLLVASTKPATEHPDAGEEILLN